MAWRGLELCSRNGERVLVLVLELELEFVFLILVYILVYINKQESLGRVLEALS